jgi:hypothetical protein
MTNQGTKWGRARSLGDGFTMKSHVLGDHTYPSDRTLRSKQYIQEKGMEVSLSILCCEAIPARLQVYSQEISIDMSCQRITLRHRERSMLPPIF